MLRMLQAEIWKLKRYRILWAGVLLMLLSVLLVLFYSTAMDDADWTFSLLVEQTIKNNATMFFPACIALIAGYLVAREQTDDTLKNILTVPVSYRALLCGKLIVCALLSLFFGLASTGWTVAANILRGFPGLSVGAVLRAAWQITRSCLFLYLAVLPIIAAAARVPNGHMLGTVVAFVYGYGGMFAAGNMTLANLYPVTASLGLIRYRSYDPAVRWNLAVCGCSLLACLLLAAAIISTATKSAPVRKKKKPKKAPPRKGW